MAPHSSTLAWKIPWMEKPGRLQSMGSLRVGHDWATSLSLFAFMYWRRKWQPTPVFLPGESQGRENLVGCVYGVAESQTGLKWLSSSRGRKQKKLGGTQEEEGLILVSKSMTLMLGKIEGRRKRRLQRMKWLDGIFDSTDMRLSKLWDIVKDWHAAVHGVTKSQTWLGNWERTSR